MVYGYARVSTKKQNLERQIRNIKEMNPEAFILTDKYTGKKLDRPNWIKLMAKVKPGDTIIFDSVSRMSRNATEGTECYHELNGKGVNLVFIKEPQINTETYKKAKGETTQLEMTGSAVDCIIKGINEYMLKLADIQIELAFNSAQKEIDELSQRTKEGLVTARLNGETLGRPEGTTKPSKISKTAKEIIKEYNFSFGGNLNDKQCIDLIKCSRNSYYKYKRELLNEE